MKKLQYVLDNYAEYKTPLEDRFGKRLCRFLTKEQAEGIDFECDGEWPAPLPWTRGNILAALEDDVRFGWLKACGERGISSGLMYDVVRSWHKILEEGLEGFDEYPMYGKPLYIATAEKYGWDLSEPFQGDVPEGSHVIMLSPEEAKEGEGMGINKGPTDYRDFEDQALVHTVVHAIHAEQAAFLMQYRGAIATLRMGGLSKEKATEIVNKAVQEIQEFILSGLETDEGLKAREEEIENSIRENQAKLGIKI